ncbi:MMPL family transporter [Nocardia jejuensis]|uniref:MMPL family transporter n=1 Tax=Nocardia jejuensis TaxID=328049 RepID=UPI000A023B90|nr:MMPL family transporter [Nocardia jejuensis]
MVALAALAMVGIGENDSGSKSPDSLPSSAESAAVKDALKQFPDGTTSSAVLVVTRTDDGELTASDLDAGREALTRMGGSPGQALVISPDRRAGLGQVTLSSDLSGFDLTDRVKQLRTAASAGAPADLRLQLTGGPAFGADVANSFSGANVLLLVVTAVVVMVLLIATYRSPVLWLLPLSVVGIADRVAASVGTGLSQWTGLAFDGSTSGITSVLVFGAGTNYALLLISRYRDELHHTDDARAALRIAVRRAGPAILASNVTVVLALSTLLLALLPNTRSLGAFAAAGLVVAVVFVLLALPPALALCGRKVFWPFIPRNGDRGATPTGLWYGIARRVVRRPAVVSVATLTLLILCASALFGTHIGLSQSEQFRVRAESVDGLKTLGAHFSSGSSDPAVVLAAAGNDARVQQILDGTEGVTRATRSGSSDTGLTRWSVVLDASPESERAFAIVASLRERLATAPEAHARVGGSDAQALDTRDAARRDQILLIPLILAMVTAVLLILLRAVPATIILVGVSALSALAALGLGSLLGSHVFGFPALDTNVPLFAFLFLVALGVDYTIFLVSRAKEETPEHGTTEGMVRAVASTGAVITSAGIVLAAVFCVLGVLPLITLTQLGIVVGTGILLDTFVVRTIVIPALFAVIGPRIWWPNPLFRVDPSVRPSLETSDPRRPERSVRPRG